MYNADTVEFRDRVSRTELREARVLDVRTVRRVGVLPVGACVHLELRKYWKLADFTSQYGWNGRLLPHAQDLYLAAQPEKSRI